MVAQGKPMVDYRSRSVNGVTIAIMVAIWCEIRHIDRTHSQLWCTLHSRLKVNAESQTVASRFDLKKNYPNR
jgi:hypothetical protein